PIVGGEARQSRQRHGPSELRDERLVHQPDARPDRAVDPSRQIREEGLHPAEAARREGGAAPSRQSRGQADQAQLGAGRLYRRAGRRPLQARRLPLLTVTIPSFARKPTRTIGAEHQTVIPAYGGMTAEDVTGPRLTK